MSWTDDEEETANVILASLERELTVAINKFNDELDYFLDRAKYYSEPLEFEKVAELQRVFKKEIERIL